MTRKDGYRGMIKAVGDSIHPYTRKSIPILFTAENVRILQEELDRMEQALSPSTKAPGKVRLKNQY